MSAGVALLIRAVEMTGDQDLALHLVEHTDLETLDVHFYAMLSSFTLAAAYERLCRCQRLIHETTRVTLEIEGDRATLRHQLPGGLTVPRQSAEFIVAAWLRGGRVVTGKEWAPSEARFAHPQPEDTREHARFFRAPVHFATGENSLVFPVSLLELPCLGADPALLALLDRYAADRLQFAPRSSRLADRARAVLAENLCGGEPSVERLASHLKMSVRTLHRALAAEGTSYRKLLDQLRQELAVRLLRDHRVAIQEVAFLTGFSELSAFYRAFKRWTRQTPAEFRSRDSR
jgi:AraC-like DNA-binding protein